ncbi:MAG: hypothetical protein ACI94Y_003460 [Maribacter sp.]|jgi:hypothetical protein
MSDTLNNAAWKKLFEKYQILEKIKENNIYEISSKFINEFREARLMTKFDYKSQLPKIFSENNLSILPIARGNYIISNFNTFKKFKKNNIEIIKIDFPPYIESIDYENITSEAIALNCAYISSMINDFTGEEKLLPTVNGRMKSSSFNFNIDSNQKILNIKVKNAQIEIDGGYEGENGLYLIEAKNSISDDFLIRQVFYPYKLWNNKISKKVKNIFLTFTNGIFHFREYEFVDPNHYNSITLIKEKKYIIRDGVINLEVIQHILKNKSIQQEPEIPFPQANSFERVINLCELLYESKYLDKNQITSNYDFDIRQTNYYTDAARYLGLVRKSKKEKIITFSLTKKGKKLFNLSFTKRQIKFIDLILSHTAFNKSIELYLDHGRPPTKSEIVAIMKTSNLHGIKSDNTYSRRSSTILGWINWILEQIEE